MLLYQWLKVINTDKTDLLQLSNMINAIDNKTRLAIMGLLYIEKKLTFEEIVEETKIDQNKIAYHINVLRETDLIKRKKKKYQNTRLAVQIMKDTGFLKEIKDIKR